MNKRSSPATRDLQDPSPTPMAPSTTPTTTTTSPSLSAGADEVSAVLLELLRKINAELPPAPPLDGQAKLAVERFQAISIDLATLTDPPLSGRPCAPRSNPSIGTSTGTGTATA